MADRIDTWIDAVVARHTAAFSTPEYLKAVRALSARYVERRAALPHRSAIDSAGKRAAFAGYFAPLHLLTTARVVAALDAARGHVSTLLDLGCGTGVAGAAWAFPAGATPPSLTGVDRDAWSLAEAAWNWRMLGLVGQTRRGDFVAALAARLDDRRTQWAETGLLFGWSINELAGTERDALAALVLAAHERGARVLVLEPLARSAVPWWNSWAAACAACGGRADEWKFDQALPPALDRLREAAGFRTAPLGARSLWWPGRG